MKNLEDLAAKMDALDADSKFEAAVNVLWQEDTGIDFDVMLEPGDDPSRESYFDFQEFQPQSGLKLMVPARIPEYFNEKGSRENRADLTISPRIKQDVMTLLGTTDPNYRGLAAAYVALIAKAALDLKNSGKALLVTLPEDGNEKRRDERRALKKGLRKKRTDRFKS